MKKLIERLFGGKHVEEVNLNVPSLYRGENRDYVKFLICTHRRSGSSLTVKLLDSHANVHALGEVFLEKRMGFNKEGYDNKDEALRVTREANPLRFLQGFIYGGYRTEIEAVGFKLFPEQIAYPHYEELRNYLSKDQTIKVIHLQRENYLAAYTSLIKAQTTGVFGIQDESQRSTDQITLEPSECEAFFQGLEDDHRWGKEFFKNHESMDLTYEEIDSNMDETFKNVQEFLGLRHQNLTTSKVKQETRSLSDVISNYSELKEHFSNSKWSKFFE